MFAGLRYPRKSRSVFSTHNVQSQTIIEDRSAKHLNYDPEEDDDETDSIASDACSPRSVTNFWGGGDEISLASSIKIPFWQKEKEDQLRKLEKDADRLSARIRRLILEQAENEEKLHKALQVHVDRSKARLAARNKVGAVLSLRRAKQMIAERSRIVSALEYLEKTQSDLLNRVNEAKAVSAQASGGFSTAASSTIFDLSSFAHFEEGLEKILSKDLMERDLLLNENDLETELHTISASSRGDRLLEI